MLSEMKHYGLEIASCLIAIAWFVYKDKQGGIGGKDIFTLSVSLVTVMSTIPISSIALLLHLVIRGRQSRLPSLSELTRIFLFLSFALLYYLLAKRITYIQLSNHAYAYLYHGPVQSISTFLNLLRSLDPRASLGHLYAFSVLPLCVVCLDSFSSIRSRRLLLLLSSVLITYIFLAGSGLYSVSAERHVIWFSSFLWAMLASAICILARFFASQRPPVFASIPFLLPVMALLPGNYRLIWQNYPHDSSMSHNNSAISFLGSQPRSKVLFWYGGAPVYYYYLRFRGELSKHDFDKSGPERSMLSSIPSPKHYDPSKNSRLAAARGMLQSVSYGSSFYVFGTHYDPDGKWPNQAPVANDLLKAFRERDCSYEIMRFPGSPVYKVKCSK